MSEADGDAQGSAEQQASAVETIAAPQRPARRGDAGDDGNSDDQPRPAVQGSTSGPQQTAPVKASFNQAGVSSHLDSDEARRGRDAPRHAEPDAHDSGD